MSEESEERQRRIQALRELAEAQAATGQLATAPVRPRAPRRAAGGRRRASALALLGVLLLASGSAWYVLGHRAPASAPAPPIPTTLTLDLVKVHLYQPVTAAWSPDGRSLAILAQAPPVAGQTPPVVAVFDGRTGKLTRRFALDTILSAQGWSGYPFSVTWQPDGKGLALPYVVSLASNPSVFEDGLLLLPLHGSARLLTAPSSDPNSPRTVWDLAAGRAVAYGELLPQALTYRFDADGHILPNSLMDPRQAPGAFSGSPASDPKQSAFSRWQAGTLDPLQSFTLGSEMPPPTDELFDSYLPQWSADGRFMAFGRIVTRVNVHGATSAPVGGAACAQPLDMFFAEACQQPAAVLPDRALQTVLTAVQVGQSPIAPDGTHLPTNWSGASVSWRPDGKVLATILPADGYFNEDPATPRLTIKVTLLSTATGQPLATVSAQRVPGAGAATIGGIAPLVWSPRGDQLAYVDYAGRVTIWGGANLALLPR